MAGVLSCSSSTTEARGEKKCITQCLSSAKRGAGHLRISNNLDSKGCYLNYRLVK